ncbi:hypothetical protein AB0L44_26430 [Nonomuraea wenchangensis]|uniref:hypothetical protein n=1 Tax=Nonomuraea wenchangensis TaxID=568860 RepID=UPI003423CFCF
MSGIPITSLTWLLGVAAVACAERAEDPGDVHASQVFSIANSVPFHRGMISLVIYPLLDPLTVSLGIG